MSKPTSWEIIYELKLIEEIVSKQNAEIAALKLKINQLERSHEATLAAFNCCGYHD